MSEPDVQEFNLISHGIAKLLVIIIQYFFSLFSLCIFKLSQFSF